MNPDELQESFFGVLGRKVWEANMKRKHAVDYARDILQPERI
jgi:hypothetical protein